MARSEGNQKAIAAAEFDATAERVVEQLQQLQDLSGRQLEGQLKLEQLFDR